MMISMRSVAVKLFTAVMLLSACQPGPSASSTELEAKLIPQILAWSKKGPPIFDLAAALPTGAYEAVCFIPDYRCLDDQKGVGRIDEYYSTFGMCIPEGSHALMLIGDRKAHAALISGTTLEFDDVPPQGKCVASARAILRTARDTQPPIVGLYQRGQIDEGP